MLFKMWGEPRGAHAALEKYSVKTMDKKLNGGEGGTLREFP
jgi:hypothetical protein